ncbi:MAG: TetR/AcrR family transcriptional regulator [Nocardioidaceae bacterium]
MSRREELVELATDYVLVHGLIDLSLRPLAAALDTSDRMLLYHFGSKDALIAAVLKSSNDRAVLAIRSMRRSPTVRSAVLDLWMTCSEPAMARCQRMYVEASALGLLGQEPYVSTLSTGSRDWFAAITDHLIGAGMPRRRATRAVFLIDATFMGLQLDLSLEPPDLIARSVRDLADAVSVAERAAR